MTSPLYMVQMLLPPRLLVLPDASSSRGGNSDDGYLLHSLFASALGDLAPKPFHHQTHQRHLEVLAYSTVDAESLLERARLFGKPDFVHALETGSSSKPMPVIATGTRLGFRVNVVPTVRAQGPAFRKGAEIDAWLAARAREQKKSAEGHSTIDRETAYAEWMQAALTRHGGATLESLRVTSLRGTRLFRRNKERAFHRLEQREVVFQGVITVTDSKDFFTLLKRGVGRHRAFGFGMLLLSPPRST
ncbi:MAG: type I-E CRISPR-associated protein Cas6/Cse3/CasE [Magnetococcales bacterium]|nr:type I-E CRISPR-associated protein Cas6/Cse3/CasE [Magnetococcales bacterium]